jgi:predicted dehydrogenase
MNKARIGVIGAGWWAVVNHLPELKKNPDCEIVAVQRFGAGDLADVQKMFDVPRGFEDYREMLAEVPMDGVIISSPHVNHFENARDALSAGCHVLVEKPMTTRTADARALVKLAARKRRQIVVPYGWNFKPFMGAARRMVAGVGRVEHVVLQMASALDDLMAGRPMVETEGARFRPPPSTWADPKRSGGYGWGQLTHALGILFRIVDLEPVKVFASTGKSPTGVDYYDALTVDFAGGATGAMSGSSTVPKHLSVQVDLRIFGTEGVLYLDIERERLELRRRDGKDEVFAMKPGDGAYTCEEPVRVFVDICRGLDVENPADGRVGQRAVEVLDAMYRSAEKGRPAKV